MAKKIDITGIIGWDATPQQLSEDLRVANGDDVEVYISSPGGLVGAGLQMYNLLRNYPGKTTAILSGYAMSMASYIPQACNVVMAEDNAVYMVHNARGGVWGDHNEVQKYGKYLEGLSGISAREFAKQTEKRGKAKSLKEIVEMMDAETFMFGDEMVDNGFVDSIITTESNNSDKETAMATAQASFAEAQARMASDQGRVRADLQLAMQIMDGDSHFKFTPPAASAAGISSKEGLQMDLKALLAANPQAQAEYDQAIKDAEARGKVAGPEEMKATVTSVAPFLSNKSYPSQVGEMALKVLTGEQQKASLDSMVAMADMMKEMQKGTGAAAGTQAAGETPGDPAAPGVVDATNVSDEAGLQAAIQLAKGGA